MANMCMVKNRSISVGAGVTLEGEGGPETD